jgi:flavin-dependent dehydrogenase
MTVDGASAEYCFEEDLFCLVDYRRLCHRLVGNEVIKERVIGYTDKEVILPEERIKAKIIVDCSGINGEKMRKNFGFEVPHIVNAIKFEGLKGDFYSVNSESFYFLVGITTFGGWIYPLSKNKIEFGMANRFRRNTDLIFPDLEGVRRILKLEGEVEYEKNAILPLGFVKKVVNRNTILFGDACGLIHPVYGMGLHYAHKIAPVLARYIKNILKGKSKLDDYQKFWRTMLKRGSSLIAQGYSSWDLSPDEQVRLCKHQINIEVSAESIKNHIWALDEKFDYYAKKPSRLVDYPLKLVFKTYINKLKLML